MKIKGCPICGDNVKLALYNVGEGPRQMCYNCSRKTPRQQYYTILARIDAAIAVAQELKRDAAAAGDKETEWVADSCIKNNQNMRDGLRCPKGVA